jgi:hypothetical protein
MLKRDSGKMKRNIRMKDEDVKYQFERNISRINSNNFIPFHIFELDGFCWEF